MIQREIINKKTGEKILSFEDGDFEFQKPVKYYGDNFIVTQMVLAGIPNEELNGEREPTEKSETAFIKSTMRWKQKLLNFKSVRISKNFISLFGTTKSNQQENLLKGQILTPEILMAIIIKADELGYTLSQYSSEHYPKGIDLSKMPFAYRVKNDGEVEKFGETELSDGQLKQAIEHRKVKIAKILDKGDEWHCFFATFKSFRGEETWLGEKQPHYHYISNSFGISRTEVINQIKSNKYKLGNLPHIKLEGYGNQPK
jgi:hypothetical protein